MPEQAPSPPRTPAERRPASGTRLRRGKSVSVLVQPEISAFTPKASGDPAPAERRLQRHKTWSAPAEADEFDSVAQQSGGEEPPARKGRLLKWAPDFLMLDAECSSAAEQTPTAAPPALKRKQRRSKTWAEHPLADEELSSKGSPTAVPTESNRTRRQQRCKTWTEQLSPADRPTPSMISRGSFSPGNFSLESNFDEEEAPDQAVRVSAGFAWKQGEKIGSGSYGCVYKALDMETGLVFAVKKALIEENSEEDRRFHENLKQELEIYKELDHPHVVSYLGHDYADSHLYIYLAYVSGGSLASFLSEFGPIKGALLQSGTRGVVEGLAYLHSRSPPIVHRDIKGANVLVDLNFCLKLADFGCSKRALDTKSFTAIGSIPWMAPEVMQQQDGHGRKADIWSLSCLVIEMATADKPWGRDKFDNPMHALRHIALSDAIPPIPEGLPACGSDFLSICLQRAASQRPAAVDLLGHRFVRDVPGKPGVPYPHRWPLSRSRLSL